MTASNLNIDRFKCDIQCVRRAAGHCGRWNCCRLPSPGKSGSSQVVSCLTLRAPRVQGGLREEKTWTPRTHSSSLYLRKEREDLGLNGEKEVN